MIDKKFGCGCSDYKYMESKIKELEEQNEVLSDTINMLSPLMMENKELKGEVMKLTVAIINLEQERLSELY